MKLLANSIGLIVALPHLAWSGECEPIESLGCFVAYSYFIYLGSIPSLAVFTLIVFLFYFFSRIRAGITAIAYLILGIIFIFSLNWITFKAVNSNAFVMWERMHEFDVSIHLLLISNFVSIPLLAITIWKHEKKRMRKKPF